MAKVTINGEVFHFDGVGKSLTEAILIEETAGMPFSEWKDQLSRGSAKAMAVYVWLVWRAGGKQVPFADILSGKEPVDAANLQIEPEGDAPDPTGGQDASTPTGGST